MITNLILVITLFQILFGVKEYIIWEKCRMITRNIVHFRLVVWYYKMEWTCSYRSRGAQSAAKQHHKEKGPLMCG